MNLTTATKPIFDRNQLPRFYSSPLNIVHHTIDYIHRHVVKSPWDEQRLRTRFVQRSVQEILQDGDAFVFGPCPARTLVAIAILNHNNIPHQIVYHERKIIGGGPPTAHFALEIIDQGLTYMFDFGYRETRFLKGPYFYHQEFEETIKLVRFQGQAFDVLNMPTEAIKNLIIAPERINMTETFDWYCQKMLDFDERLLRDRIIYDMQYSHYNLPAHLL
jgi:hypothetical protein